MKVTLLRVSSFVLSCIIVSSAGAQSASSGISKFASKRSVISSEGVSVGTPSAQKNDFFVPMPDAISIQGATAVGVGTKYHLQTNRGGLHNIQVDPSNPQNVHAVIMSVPNVTVADTVGNAYKNRNCYYVFSSDGGSSWSTPKAVSPTRSGFPAMVLRKNSSGAYVPVIALHRYTTKTSTDFITSLYMETGAPGAGNFVGLDADRSLGDGTTGDVIWPSVALSADGTKAYVASAFSDTNPADPKNPTYNFLQFGIFTISDAGPSAWSGWKTGPDDGANNGYSTNGEHMININAAGTIGIAWVSYNFGASERGLYYAETKNEGATWINQTQLWEPNDSTTEVTLSNASAFLVANALDLQYEYNTPYIAFSALDEDVVAGGTYVPASGTLGIWSPAINSGAPFLLLSKTRANAYNTGDFLSNWNGGDSVDIQGDANLMYSTLAHPPGSPDWIIYFQAWVNQDVAPAYDTNTYAYFSIYRMTSHDDGQTWTVEPVRTNDPAGTDQKFDYRFPEVSTFLPKSEGGLTTLPIMFGADTAAGSFGLSSAGKPGWDNMDWYAQPDTLNTANDAVALAKTSLAVSERSFPNPFTTSAKISFTLAEQSNVVLTVEDMLGRPIATLVNGPLGPGDHSAMFNAVDLPNGVYSYTLRANGQSISKSMSLIR